MGVWRHRAERVNDTVRALNELYGCGGSGDPSDVSDAQRAALSHLMEACGRSRRSASASCRCRIARPSVVWSKAHARPEGRGLFERFEEHLLRPDVEYTAYLKECGRPLCYLHPQLAKNRDVPGVGDRDAGHGDGPSHMPSKGETCGLLCVRKKSGKLRLRSMHGQPMRG